MKYTVIGDLHIKPDNLDKISKLFEQVEELGNPTIFLGDQLDTKEVIRGKCLNILYNYLRDSKLNHNLLIGNHCYFNLECEDHSQEVLKELPNVTIIDSPRLLDGNENIRLIPYIHNQDKLEALISKLPEDSYLFGHLEIASFDFGNGHICEDGTDLASFSKFKKVISGHFHKYQQKGNLTYLGTPFSHSFGESNQTKYIGVFDSDTGELELIETDFPQHITIELDCSNDKPITYNEDNHNRVILKGSEEDIANYPKELLEGCKIIERPTSIEHKDIEISETQDLVSQFQAWSDIKELDPKTKELGVSILKGVINA